MLVSQVGLRSKELHSFVKKCKYYYLGRCIQTFPDWAYTEVNNKHSLRSNTKGYGGKTH
jgi:hypothetical protein